MEKTDQTLAQYGTSQEMPSQVIPEQITTAPKSWGFWAMLGFSFLFPIASFAISVTMLFAAFQIAMIRNPDLQFKAFYPFVNSGLFLGLVTVAMALIIIGLSILFASMSKITVKEYLCLKKANLKQYCFWVIAIIIFGSLHEVLKQLLGRPSVPQIMLDIYDSAGSVPLLLFSIVIIAPITEELFYRGFLFSAFKSSKVGVIGAIILTSFLWAAIHWQYDLFDIITIFPVGILLCIARIKTESIYVPIAMHSLTNLIATGELILFKYHIIN